MRRAHDNNAKKDFCEIIKGVNVMSDYIIGYYYSKSRKYAIELSYGEFMDSKIYGVTVADLESKENSRLSKSFNSEIAALEYINSL